MKKFAYLLCFSCLGLLLASCQKPDIVANTDSEQKNLPTLSIMPIGIENEAKPLIEALQSKFPQYVIRNVSCGCGYDESIREAQKMMKNGELDIVTLLGTGTMKDWSSQNLLKDLTPFMNMEKAEMGQLSRVLEKVKYNQKVYMFPFAIESPLAVVINEELFKEKQIDIPTNEWTWDDFNNLTAKLASSDKKIWGFSSSMLELLPMTYLVQNNKGYTWLNDSLQITNTSNFFENMVNGVYQVRPATKKEFSDTRIVGGVNIDDFSSEKAAMSLQLTTSLPYYQKEWGFSWNILPLPNHKNSDFTAINPISFAVSNSSKHDKEAWDILKYMAGKGAIHVAKSGHVPITFTEELLKEWLNRYNSLPSGIKYVYPKKWDQIEDISEKDYYTVYKMFNKSLYRD
ncbi:ABC transporter substrate-binding protein [Paenibacillus sp. GYB003]|uniref:ABC transporter substrate-binding protein n=1 Tax=Paenibacillus sp. GYB003 TaxID=2994392 RepID=UPI002F96C8D0